LLLILSGYLIILLGSLASFFKVFADFLKKEMEE